MKTPIFALLALLLMMSMVGAVSLPPVLVGYLEPNLTISVAVLNTSQGAAYVLSIDGKETLMASDWNNALVSDPTTMSALLKENIQRSSDFENAHVALDAAISDLQARRVHPESQCALMTGTDQFPCFDRESCVIAAKPAGDSQSSVMIQADGFWQAMRDEVVERGNLNISMQTLLSANASAQATAPSARAIASEMGDVSTKVTSLYTNNLFLNQHDAQCTGSAAAQCFEYCPKINWTADSSGWTALQNRFATIATQLDSLDAQDARAAALSKASVVWINYSQNKGALWSVMQNGLQSKRTAVEIKLSSASAKQWNDTALLADWATWKAQADGVKALGDDGQFHAALQSQTPLSTAADNISARIDANNKAVTQLQANLASIDKSVSALAGANANSTDIAGLRGSAAQLKAGIKYPISASQLPALTDQSAKLEQLVLAQVGQMTLGLPAQSGANVTAQANEITGGNGSTGAKPPASPSAASGLPVVSQLKSAGCPLPIGLVLAVLAAMLVLGTARVRNSSE